MPVDVQIVSIVMGALAFTGTVASLTWAWVHFSVKKKELEMRDSDAELGREVEALRDDLNDTRAQLADMQERLDFTERVLTAGRASQEDRGG
jgi:predicted nuclease with TOPRIM domain